VDSVAKHADLHVRTRDGGELEGATETLVLGGVISLKTELEIDGLDELALLALNRLAVAFGLATTSKLEDGLDGVVEELGVDFTL
jgi:hypothetical protein